MKLKKLLKDIPEVQVRGSKEIEITGVCANSRVVAPGNLFVAKRGGSHDGNRYIPEAAAAGAVAVLTDLYDPSLTNLVQLIHPNVHETEALIAAHYYQFPSDELFIVGVTGTNGKTTTSFILKHLVDTLRGPCGLIGTIEYIIGKQRYQATRTTPDVATNQKMLREMVLQGCRSAVMEVTSHALDQQRVAYIDYDVAVFSNLTLDHLDYHGTMEEYCKAKNLLFRSLGKKNERGGAKQFSPTAIINADDQWHLKIVEGCTAAIMTYGIDKHADIQGSNIELSQEGSTFTVVAHGTSARFSIPLVGKHNVYNALAAICVGLTQEVTLGTMADILGSVPAIPGRLEAVPNCLGLRIYVDFAHTDDALRKALVTLQGVKKGKIITVFGCGGDRDRSKRPKMAKVCEELSNYSIVTSDNPRSEDPTAICQEILAGFSQTSCYEVELDRAKAIEKAICMATPQDIVLIAGKGHEKSQVFAHRAIEFDDCKVARERCEALESLNFCASNIEK